MREGEQVLQEADRRTSGGSRQGKDDGNQKGCGFRKCKDTVEGKGRYVTIKALLLERVNVEQSVRTGRHFLRTPKVTKASVGRVLKMDATSSSPLGGAAHLLKPTPLTCPQSKVVF